jgi:hypothetical protein
MPKRSATPAVLPALEPDHFSKAGEDTHFPWQCAVIGIASAQVSGIVHAVQILGAVGHLHVIGALQIASVQTADLLVSIMHIQFCRRFFQ